MACTLTSFAEVKNGYYRIQNNDTDRYITVWDNTFDVSYNTSDVDLSALVTIRDFNKIVCDPGSIIYIENAGNNECRLQAQGTDTYVASGGYYLKLREQSNGTYMATVTAKGMMKMLGDSPDPNKKRDQAYVTTQKDGNTRFWKVLPINDTDNYLGLNATLSDGTHHYTSFYASFPYSAKSADTKFYRVVKVDQGMAVVEEIKGEVPAATPVFVKTKSANAADNKLNVLRSSSVGSVGANVLNGNYFNYWKRGQETPYNPATMRVLGKLSDGSIGFVKSSTLEFLDRNSAYLPVTEDCPAELKIVTLAEYEQEVNKNKTYNVTFIIDGITVGTQTVKYGEAINAIDAPAKEGHTFNGWSEIPSSMPANDITIIGSYSKNSYTLIYIVDGKEMGSFKIEYGAGITPLDEPSKEGHTFSGWGEIPETMPAEHITITGSFERNCYTVTYKIEGVIVGTQTVEFEGKITPIEAPTKEGHIFNGWENVPATMPAGDITITGSYSVDSGINYITDESTADVYDIYGRKVAEKLEVSQIDTTLPSGIYIIKGKKHCVK